MKVQNNKAWLMVLPMLLLVAVSAIIPLMTVVNYSVQDTFGNNEFFWVGTEWFQEVLASERFHNALQRTLLFSALILAIEIPLGIAIALAMPRRGIAVSFCLVLMALPLLIPWNVVGTIWQVFGRVDIGLLGHGLASLGNRLQLHAEYFRCLGYADYHGRMALDEPCRAAVLLGLGVHSRSLLSSGTYRWRIALGDLSVHSIA